MSRYLFDNAAEDPTAQRFAGLETLYDPRTQRQLTATGLTVGWHCLEVGAGGGSIARWLAEQVGPTGYVLATDLDPRFLSTLATSACPQLEVRRHDIVTDALPADAFDLVHARLVLLHLPTAADVLGRLVTTVRPGGWLVGEDFDPTFIDRAFPVSDSEDAAATGRTFRALGELLAERGAGTGWARGLHGHLTAAGLTEVRVEGSLEIRTGASAGARVDTANLTQVGAGLVDAGRLAAADLARVLTLLRDPAFAYASPMLFTAWGRRPS
jgi:SAM-dependent methyltransferase